MAQEGAGGEGGVVLELVEDHLVGDGHPLPLQAAPWGRREAQTAGCSLPARGRTTASEGVVTPPPRRWSLAGREGVDAPHPSPTPSPGGSSRKVLAAAEGCTPQRPASGCPGGGREGGAAGSRLPPPPPPGGVWSLRKALALVEKGAGPDKVLATMPFGLI